MNRNGNRASKPVVGKRPRSPSASSPFVSSFLRHSYILLPLLFLILPDVLGFSNESTRSPAHTTSALAFRSIALVPKHRSSFCRLPFTGGKIRKGNIAILQVSSSGNHNENNNNNSGNSQNKIRLNKVFKKTHSRREADRLIEEGRVSVNGERVVTKGGFFVVPYVDQVSLDGTIIEGWEEMNYVANNNNDSAPTTANSGTKGKPNPSQHLSKKNNRRNSNSNPKRTKRTFEYIKYWKPAGVICTTDPNIPGNIIDEIREHDGYDPPHRVYPVGRLDKETTGIILLTSDGRLPNAALRKQHKRPKIYEVMVDPPIGRPGSPKANRVLDQLANGVVISTETVRNGVRKTLTAPTEPCQVEQLNDRWIRITLKEGRNRQVRKMTQAVGHKTIELERVSFAGIPLEPGLRGPGDWDYLNQRELQIVQDMIQIAQDAHEAEGAYWETE